MVSKAMDQDMTFHHHFLPLTSTMQLEAGTHMLGHNTHPLQMKFPAIPIMLRRQQQLVTILLPPLYLISMTLQAQDKVTARP